MNIQDFKVYCEDFFKVNYFQSENDLVKEISHLTAQEFKEWNIKMMDRYDKKYDIIRSILKEMREKEGFNTNIADIDWDKDPIKKEENKVIVKSYQEVYNNVFNEKLKTYEIYQKKLNELHESIKQEQYQNSLKVTVDGKDFVAEKVIDVFWSGWECDDKAWLVNDDGKMRIIVSDHGHKYFTDKSFLEQKIKEYQSAIEETNEVLNQLN